MRFEEGAKYRWLAVGERVRYVGRDSRPELRGREGEVVGVPTYGEIGNVAVLLDGKEPMLAPAGCWRRT